MTYIFTTEKWNEDEKWRIQSENTLNIGHIVHCQCAKPYIFSKQHIQGQLHINSPTPKMKEPLYYGFWVLYIFHLVHELCTQYFCYLATNNIFRLHVIFWHIFYTYITEIQCQRLNAWWNGRLSMRKRCFIFSSVYLVWFFSVLRRQTTTTKIPTTIVLPALWFHETWAA